MGSGLSAAAPQPTQLWHHQGESRWRRHGLCLVLVSRGTRGCRILSTLAPVPAHITKHRVGNPTARPGQGSSLACQEKFPPCSRSARCNAELGCCSSRGDCVPVDVGHLPGAPRVLVAREAQPGRTWQAMKGDGFLPQPASRHVAKPLPLVRCHPGLSHLCAGHASEC